MGCLDPVLEDHEKQTGRVATEDFDRWLNVPAKPERKRSWLSATPEEIEMLKELVRLAAGDSTAEPATYICETCWSTLDLDSNDDGAQVKFNLRVC